MSTEPSPASFYFSHTSISEEPVQALHEGFVGNQATILKASEHEQPDSRH